MLATMVHVGIAGGCTTGAHVIVAAVVGLALLSVPMANTANAAPRAQVNDERITSQPPLGGRSSGAVPVPALSGMPQLGPKDRPGDSSLVPQTDGSFLYADPQGQFTMSVTPDGQVLFADRWRRPDKRNTQRGKLRPGRALLLPFAVLMGSPFGGPLEWMVRASGRDLLTGSKMAALHETAKFRTALAISWSRAQVKKRLRELPNELLQVWSADHISLARRKEILFERWDECEDRLGIAVDGIPPDAVEQVDKTRRAAAQQARATIEAFVRRHAGSQRDTRFTASELEAFNRRRASVRAFAPYTRSVSAPATATPALQP